MTHILVTGGSGGLGRELVPRLHNAGYRVRVMSRGPRPAGVPEGADWAQADLETGAGVRQAVSGVETILHAASNPIAHTYQVDVAGTRQLLEAARQTGVRHFIYVSIVGIERIPNAYYKIKVAAEEVTRAGGVPYTILRATQFHSLIDYRLSQYRSWPIMFTYADFKFQTIDTGEAADRLVTIAGQPPAGLLPDLGGPQVLTLGEMARAWLAAQGLRRSVIGLPLPGRVAHGFRSGYNTCPDHRDGKITWAEWLAQKYARRTRAEAQVQTA